ncbi:hypothetical protein JCM6882_003858 [Rhodosporidiobolus microsporus]
MATTAPSSSPAAFIVPSTSSDRRLDSSSSLSWAGPGAGRAAHSSVGYHNVQPTFERHAITLLDVANWRQSHKDERLRPPVGTDAVMDKATLNSYKAPQHPASHVLHSIPPRAPSRSSRSNILSYTIHLATSSRLSSYSAPSGSRSLLYYAEATRDHDEYDHDSVFISDAWFDAEQKTQGLHKLGSNLLQSSKKNGSLALPPAVERRVDLASLAEDLLVSPSAERAVTKIDADSTQPSSEVDELAALKPLTTPDTTTLYHTTSASAGQGVESEASSRPRVNSVAQSLIDLKFGGKADPSEQVSPSLLDDKPLPSTSASGEASSSSSSSAAARALAQLDATPHMDYRIVLSQSMRTRARTIFSTSPLPALTTSYCRSHRVPSCAVCAAMCARAGERESDHARLRRTNVPGSGLTFVPSSSSSNAPSTAGNKRALVALVPEFLNLSAALLKDVKERANRPFNFGADEAVDEALLAQVVATESTTAVPSAFVAAVTAHGGSGAADEKGKAKEEQPPVPTSTTTVELQVTSAWYDLLTMLLVQACLEGYLVDGWTGTEGVEVLFGVGCGVWEGRSGWSARSNAAAAAARAPAAAGRSESGDSDSSDSEDEEEYERRVEEERRRKREEETRVLVDAARALFGSRDVAQADYERGMRDKTHEFLNVPASKTLHQHLDYLGTKYPMSQFEDAMVDFIEASVRLLGKPALAKHDPRSSTPASSNAGAATTPTSAGGAGAANDSAPDNFALIRYFAPASFATTPPLALPSASSAHAHKEDEDRGRERRPHRAWEEGGRDSSEGGAAKRRRVD